MTDAILAAEVAEAAARAGGDVLMARRGGELDIDYKDTRANLVTIADHESQRAVAETILTAFPDHAIDGEEGTAGNSGAADVWYVDPLDGTTNFAHGLPFFCVSVGLRSRGRTVAGAVYDPMRDEMFVAALSGGASLNGVPIGVSEVARLDRALVRIARLPARGANRETKRANERRWMRWTPGLRGCGRDSTRR